MQLLRGTVVSVAGTVPQGSTLPLYARVRLSDGSLVSSIVKFPTYEKRVPVEAPVSEWIATALASKLGIKVSSSCLVTASTEVSSYIYERFGFTVSAHLGFGTEIAPIDTLIFPSGPVRFAQVDTGRIFCFDLLFLNSDRTETNPNCGEMLGEPFAYDFGAAMPAPTVKVAHFERFFFGRAFADRVNSHLFRSNLPAGSELRAIASDMIERAAREIDVLNRSGQDLQANLRHHLELIEHYILFLEQKRDLVVQRIVDTV